MSGGDGNNNDDGEGLMVAVDGLLQSEREM